MRLVESTASGAYTGIGSREISPDGYELARQLGFYLAAKGLRLRSGGAVGADSAFAEGAGLKRPDLRDIFLPRAVPAWCYEEVAHYLDPGVSLVSMRPHVQALLARNMQQVLGRDGGVKSTFLLYWTPVQDGTAANAGGTRYAVRAARAHCIPTLNILDSDLSSVVAWVSDYL